MVNNLSFLIGSFVINIKAAPYNLVGFNGIDFYVSSCVHVDNILYQIACAYWSSVMQYHEECIVVLILTTLQTEVSGLVC